jgi:hypothetical protein
MGIAGDCGEWVTYRAMVKGLEERKKYTEEDYEDSGTIHIKHRQPLCCLFLWQFCRVLCFCSLTGILCVLSLDYG